MTAAQIDERKDAFYDAVVAYLDRALNADDPLVAASFFAKAEEACNKAAEWLHRQEKPS